MRERPIPFSGPLVRALLAGRKTQTRRLVTQVAKCSDAQLVGLPGSEPTWIIEAVPPGSSGRVPFFVRSRYGMPGDRLYVRETIRRIGEPEGVERWCRSVYGADDSLTVADCWPWKRSFLPPMHCPRGLSRITLEVTGVRIERLQAITAEDARAEGLEVHVDEGATYYGPLDRGHADARLALAGLWDTINGKREGCSWDADPWVWVVSFRPVEVSRG